MKFQYSPGLIGYGTKGADGSAGLQGFAIYFTDFDPNFNRINIENAIENDYVLWSIAAPNTKLANGRVYITGDQFVVSNGDIYIIDASLNTYIWTGHTLSKTQLFEYAFHDSDDEFKRYHNINFDVSKNHVIIDNVLSSQKNYDYSKIKVYGIEGRNFARIEYTNIDNSIGRNAFTVYSIGENSIIDDRQALAIVRETSSNTFRIGNIDFLDFTTNTALTLDVSGLVHNRNGNTGLFPASVFIPAKYTEYAVSTGNYASILTYGENYVVLSGSVTDDDPMNPPVAVFNIGDTFTFDASGTYSGAATVRDTIILPGTNIYIDTPSERVLTNDEISAVEIFDPNFTTPPTFYATKTATSATIHWDLGDFSPYYNQDASYYQFSLSGYMNGDSRFIVGKSYKVISGSIENTGYAVTLRMPIPGGGTDRKASYVDPPSALRNTYYHPHDLIYDCAVLADGAEIKYVDGLNIEWYFPDHSATIPTNYFAVIRRPSWNPSTYTAGGDDDIFVYEQYKDYSGTAIIQETTPKPGTGTGPTFSADLWFSLAPSQNSEWGSQLNSPMILHDIDAIGSIQFTQLTTGAKYNYHMTFYKDGWERKSDSSTVIPV